AMDEPTYEVTGYSDDELQAQVNRLKRFGPAGQQVIDDGKAFIDGINARIDEDIANPTEMPAEYPALQVVPTHWTEGDVVAVAELIQATFAAGGGGELQNAMFLRDAQKKLGARRGELLWRDMREMNDPAAPTSADARFPYMVRRG